MKSFSTAQLTAQIEEKLAKPPFDGYGLKARVYEGGLVQLQGIVDVLDEKLQVTRAVQEIPGVRQIDNDITVCTDGGIDDRDVAFEVGEELTANPEVPLTVGAVVAGGEVRLKGSVSNIREAREAIETAAKARGVREVHSELHLEDEVDDASLSNAIQTAFRAVPGLVSGQIKIDVHEGMVTLGGELPAKQTELALETVAAVPGVKRIYNELNQRRMDTDDRVVVAMMEAIAANPYLKEAPIDISVENGRIIMEGSVDSLEGKKDIEIALRDVIGSFRSTDFTVDNRIRLE